MFIFLLVSWSCIKYYMLVTAGAFIYCCCDDFDISFRYFLSVIPLLLAKDALADSTPSSGKLQFGYYLIVGCMYNFIVFDERKVLFVSKMK